MATTNPARSPKRIRRWLQTTAVGAVLVSSSLFGLIAVQGANAARSSSSVAQPSSAAIAATSTAAAGSATTSSAVDTASMSKQTTATATAVPTVQARTRAS